MGCAAIQDDAPRLNASFAMAAAKPSRESLFHESDVLHFIPRVRRIGVKSNLQSKSPGCLIALPCCLIDQTTCLPKVRGRGRYPRSAKQFVHPESKHGVQQGGRFKER
jgi:hypothetical protein